MEEKRKATNRRKSPFTNKDKSYRFSKILEVQVVNESHRCDFEEVLLQCQQYHQNYHQSEMADENPIN